MSSDILTTLQLKSFSFWIPCTGWKVPFWQFFNSCKMAQKVCWQPPVIFCLYTFPPYNLNFHWRWKWWDWIQGIFLNLFYFNSKSRIWHGWYSVKSSLIPVCSLSNHSLSPILTVIVIYKAPFSLVMGSELKKGFQFSMHRHQKKQM